MAEPTPFSVVLPAFDEEGGLLATLDELRAVLARGDCPYEILIVDDGSRDGTPRILATCHDVTVIRHPQNRGYGAALKTGILAARHPLVVVMDADGTYAPTAVPRLVERCASADMVVGARLGSRVQSDPARGAVKWCFRQFAQWITGTRIPDLNSGLRVFRRPVAERCMALLPDGFSFTTTITVASLVERLTVAFEVVDYMPRIGRSKVRPLRDTLRIARQLLRLGVRLAPLRTALAVAAPLLLVSLGLLVAHLGRGQALGAAEIVGLALSLLLLALGGAAEQRVRRRRDLAAAEILTSPGSA
ncbi:MAG TPA: glycosyltransferase family 2 protein [Candidatus Dormibacteraeota bacterium]|nr:glycosyltransferase family 2 protein [Candidatus Dormibacteraeota bacterium]